MFFKSSSASQVRSSPVSGRSAIPSLLSADICIKGDVRSSGEIQVDGRIEGDVDADCVVVSEHGTVNGTVAARTVRVLGTVTGAITAGSIRLARTARLTGDIVHDALSIEEGAIFLGHCHHAETAASSAEPLDQAKAVVADPAAEDALSIPAVVR